jgi:putative redox protein
MRPPAREAPAAREQLIVRTTRGSDVRVGRLAPGGAERAGRSISLGIGRAPGCADGAGAVLTPAEARQLAAALLREAAAADGGTADGATSQVEVSYLGGESYAVATRGHTLLTDQPATAGGADTAMTPTELLVASLSSCVAFYAGRYLARHALNRDGLRVTAAFTIATDRPARVAGVRLAIQVPGGIPPSREAALLAVAAHCTVHNTLRQPPDITIELSQRQRP